ncbi:hypothetical protein BPOR_1611g00010 [Botrytis porri]|uniref:Uncharacterized protein n=1 Tax=Botrytis porri TaxID=87229 RepID=A0A4Z1K432_9HELO|nr:hypothetical protein BPOR_1611g00010 [Botrytis porri]
MIPTSSIVMTSTGQPLELNDSSSNSSITDSWQSDNEFLDNFDLHKYSADTMKETSPNLAQPSTSGVLDSIMKVPSDLSAETPSKLSVPTCPVATGIVDNEGVWESVPLTNLLEAPVLRVLDETACEPEALSKDSEASEVVDNEAIVSKPCEVETEQLTTTISVQHPSELIVIDLTDSSDEESAPPVTLRKVQKDQKLTASQSQENTSPAGRRTRPKTSSRKHLSDENVFLTSSVQDIEEMLQENKREMALVERKRARLVALKNKFLAWGVHDQKVTREWEGTV